MARGLTTPMPIILIGVSGGLIAFGLGGLWRLIGVMIATVSVLMAAHVCEVTVWALAYGLTNAAPPGADLFYFAFMNYTTLGYGDATPVARWRLLGPITAMNGVLLFGWSTAVIFEVLRRAMRSGPQLL